MRRWMGSTWVRRLLAGGVALFLIAGLFLGGAQPQAVNLVPAPWDKLAHLGVYALLSLSCGLAAPVSLRLAPLVGLLAALTLGLLDEWHQVSLPGRQADLADWLADAAGALLGAGLLLVLVRVTGGQHDVHG